jgi:hypothetical protein
MWACHAHLAGLECLHCNARGALARRVLNLHLAAVLNLHLALASELPKLQKLLDAAAPPAAAAAPPAASEPASGDE